MRRQLIFFATGLLVAFLGVGRLDAFAGTATRLFVIERNKNANYVCYDANLTDDGQLDPVKPISVYWIMAAKDGHREELTGLERKRAYGFSLRHGSNGELILSTKALQTQAIVVSVSNGVARAETELDGRRSILKKIYVQAGEGLIPKVNFVRFTGTDANTGEPVETMLHP